MLEMREYKVKIAVVPTMFEIKLGIAKTEFKTIKIKGYTLKDAMKRNHIR